MATTWTLDPTHSEIIFKVKHLMISNVKGQFNSFTAGIESTSDTDFSAAAVTASIDAISIDTNNTDRDAHLKSADFFDAENFPTLSFEGSSFKAIDAENFELTGNLTIKGVINPITLQVEFGGINKDPWGNEKAGFSFTGKLNRKDYGLNWNAALETGGVLVSDEVKLSGELQFVKSAQ